MLYHGQYRMHRQNIAVHILQYKKLTLQPTHLDVESFNLKHVSKRLIRFSLHFKCYPKYYPLRFYKGKTKKNIICSMISRVQLTFFPIQKTVKKALKNAKKISRTMRKKQTLIVSMIASPYQILSPLSTRQAVSPLKPHGCSSVKVNNEKGGTEKGDKILFLKLLFSFFLFFTRAAFHCVVWPRL